MEEILQTKQFKPKASYCLCIFSYPHSCILHVEPVAQDYVAVEEEAVEVEVQEELQELEAAKQIEDQEFDLANPDPQPGKHRFIYPRVLHNFKFGASIGSI